MATEIWHVDQPKNTTAGGYMSYKHEADEVDTVYIHNNRYYSGFQCNMGWRLPFGSDHYECWSYDFFTKFQIPTTTSGVMQSAELYVMLGRADMLLNVLPVYMDVDIYYKTAEVAADFPLQTLDADDHDDLSSWTQNPDSIEDFYDMYGDYLIYGPHWRPAVTVTSGIQHAIDQGYDYATFRFTPNFPTPLDWDYDTRPTPYDQFVWAVFYGPVNAFSVLPPTGAGFDEAVISPCPWLKITYSGGETQFYPGEDVTESGQGSVVNCIAADQRARMAIAGTGNGNLWYTWSGGVLWDKMYEAEEAIMDVHMDYIRNFLDYPTEEISYFGTVSGNLYKSEDSLGSFNIIHTFDAGIVEIMSSDTDSDKVVVGVTDGVWVSSDGGSTFIEVLEAPAGLWFEGLHNWGDEIQVVFASGYGYRSPDFGATWYQMSGLGGVDTRDVAFNVANEQDSFIGADSYLYIMTSANGETYHYSQGATISGIVRRIDVDHDSVVAVIGTDSKLHKTMDWGETIYDYWDGEVDDVALGGHELVTIVPYPFQGTGHPYHHLVVQPGGELYLCWTPYGYDFSSGDEICYRSLNYGESWDEFLTSSGLGPGVTASPQMVSPHASGWLAGARDQEIYRSTTGEPGTWVDYFDSHENRPHVYTLKTSTRVIWTNDNTGGSYYHDIRSLDGGDTLDSLQYGPGPFNYMTQCKMPPDQSYSVYRDGYRGIVYYNTSPWTSDYPTGFGPGASSGMHQDFGVHHGDGRIIIRQNDDMYCYDNWDDGSPTIKSLPGYLTEGSPWNSSFDIDPSNSDRVLLMTKTDDPDYRGLWMSEDFCDTWTFIANYWFPKDVNEQGPTVLYDQFSPGYVYAWSVQGFFVSTDNGYTWTAKSQGINI